jgi:hypothetical protein
LLGVRRALVTQLDETLRQSGHAPGKIMGERVPSLLA